MVTPVFLLSLPRSGSTMLQRELARHPEIATVSEPWFMLGLVQPTAGMQVAADYDHHSLRVAFEDLIARLPGGEADWSAAARAAAQLLYDRLAGSDGGDARFFLDKTPRYALVPEEIRAIFPEAPIVVLWRNPLAIAASMMSTYSGGRWNLFRFVQDLDIALPRLVAFVEAHRGAVLCLRYEDLSYAEGTGIDAVLEHLDLAVAGDKIMPQPDPLQGRLGDPTRGLNRAAAGLGEDRWKAMFGNPLRRAWARRYLRRIGAARLAIMGYDLDTLEAELASCKGMWSQLCADLVLMPRGVLRRLFLTRLVRGQLRKMLGGRPTVEFE